MIKAQSALPSAGQAQAALPWTQESPYYPTLHLGMQCQSMGVMPWQRLSWQHVLLCRHRQEALPGVESGVEGLRCGRVSVQGGELGGARGAGLSRRDAGRVVNGSCAGGTPGAAVEGVLVYCTAITHMHEHTEEACMPGTQDSTS